MESKRTYTASCSFVGPKQHTSLTISWLQAKVLFYFLQAKITAHEMECGKIVIPQTAFPPEPVAMPELFKTNPLAEPIYNKLLKLHKEFVTENIVR